MISTSTGESHLCPSTRPYLIGHPSGGPPSNPVPLTLLPSLPRGIGPNPYKVAILLEALNIPYKCIPLEFGDAVNGVKGAAFLAVNPNGRVPAIVDHDNGDFVVWE